MPKTCEHEGCDYNVWGGGYCKIHQGYRPKKNKGNKPKKSPLKKVSGPKAKRDKVYSVLRKEFLLNNPVCQICCSNHAGEIHHKYAGADRAKYQNDTTTWMALCHFCHKEIHENPAWARENNYLK